jgi:hypothetical protein
MLMDTYSPLSISQASALGPLEHLNAPGNAFSPEGQGMQTLLETL